MRYWIYAEPAGSSSEPIYTLMSDAAVLADYWDYWSNKMMASGMAQDLSHENCILDWATIHWAWEATPENLLGLIQNEDAQTS